MDLYSRKSKSTPQKLLILFLEVLLIALSYWILFEGGYQKIFSTEVGVGNIYRHWVLFIFNCIVFGRICITLFLFIKRSIPWTEAFNIPFAFTLYYIGFALLGYSNNSTPGIFFYTGIFLFILGSCINTFSELLRYNWKKDPGNKGKLYTKGLFKYAIHINYFGDLLWVIGYAFVTGNIYSSFIPLFLFTFFAFYNIPMLDKHLKTHYGQAFENYKAHTKSFIPFIW